MSENKKRYEIRYTPSGDDIYDNEANDWIETSIEGIADLLNRQAEQIEALREALEPFSGKMTDGEGDFIGYYLLEDVFSPEQFKTAAKALRQAGEE